MASKHLSWFVFLVCFTGCSNQPSNAKPPKLVVHQVIVPPEYQQWLKKNQRSVTEYKNFLKQHHTQFPAPDFQMLRSARDWKQCNASEFDVPHKSVWKNAVPTFKLMEQLKIQNVIPLVEVTSSYRSPALNRCAGGAKASSHLSNSAIDFRIGSPNPRLVDQIKTQHTKAKLCRFWKKQGKQYNMGLGIYPTGQIHIDTNGYRTWGYNHRWQSSLCAAF